MSPVDFAKTLEVRDRCLCFSTQRAARALARRFDRAFRPLGLTSGQFSLLNALNRPTAPTLGSIAAFLCMDRTTLTAALKPLARAGLVEVSPDPGDRRQKLLVLRDSGRALLQKAWPIWTAEHEALERETFGDAGTTVLRAGLAALAA
jgi:DNA-binding MarR family transcriptional regulator